MPEVWSCLGHDSGDLSRLIQNLYQRRSVICNLITAFRNSTRNPFPELGRQLASRTSARHEESGPTARAIGLSQKLFEGVQAAPVMLPWPVNYPLSNDGINFSVSALEAVFEVHPLLVSLQPTSVCKLE